MLLDGAYPHETDALRALDHLGNDPVGAFTDAAREMSDAFGEPDALTRIVHHPAGDRTGAALLDLRIMDFTVHAWDLARAISTSDTLNDALVGFVNEILFDIVDEMKEKGYFASSRVASGGNSVERMLRLTGREPTWTPPAT